MAAVTTDRLVQLAADLAAEPDAYAACEVYESGTRISHIFFGLDVGPAELFLARQLGYHAVVSYASATPFGPASAHTTEARLRRMLAVGVPEETAQTIADAERTRARFAALRQNADHAPSIARLLEMPFVSVGPALAHVARRVLRETIDTVHLGGGELTVAAAIDALKRLPSFAAAQSLPLLLDGDWNAPIGRFEIEPGESAADVAQAYFAAGITTLFCFSVSSETAAAIAASTTPGALIVLGRGAGESTGVLAYVERLRAEGVEVTTSAGVLGDHHSA